MDLMKNKAGFTLVEVIVSVAILSIIIFAFSILFTTSFTGIFNAGRKSEALFKVQEEMDKRIAEGLSNDFDSSNPDQLTIQFDHRTVTVDGEIKEEQVSYDNNEKLVDLYYFMPDIEQQLF